MSSSRNNVVGMPVPAAKNGQRRTPGAQSAINAIQTSFTKILREDIGGYWVDEGEIKPKGISYGAYNELTYRAQDGTVIHACGALIDEMRSARQFTRNAVELRCDALGLAVYVSGVTQIDTKTNKLQTYLRVASYQHKKTNPELSIAKTSVELYTKVHTILVSTYNHLGREYNIAGLNNADLTLVSDSVLIPNIVINQPC